MVKTSKVAAITSMSVMALLLAYRDTPVQAARSNGNHRCSNIQLLISPTSKGLGAALGHGGRWYRMHVLWGAPCTLRGFPHVLLLDRHFHPLPSQVGRGGYIIPTTLPVRRVVLDRQHDAYFALEDQDVPSGNQPCRQVPYLMVTPPGDKLPVVTFGNIALCPGPDDTSPIEPAAALR